MNIPLSSHSYPIDIPIKTSEYRGDVSLEETWQANREIHRSRGSQANIAVGRRSNNHSVNLSVASLFRFLCTSAPLALFLTDLNRLGQMPFPNAKRHFFSIVKSSGNWMLEISPIWVWTKTIMDSPSNGHPRVAPHGAEPDKNHHTALLLEAS